MKIKRQTNSLGQSKALSSDDRQRGPGFPCNVLWGGRQAAGDLNVWGKSLQTLQGTSSIMHEIQDS